MKKRLNIFCLLVVLVLGYSVFESVYQFGTGMKLGIESGVEAGYKAGKKKERLGLDAGKMLNMKPVALVPDSYPFFTDSVINAKTGEYVPIMYSQILVSVDTKNNMGQTLAVLLAAMVHIFASLVAAILFVFLVISINKSDIFNWKNVFRLRWLGAVLIVSFFCSVLPVCIANSALSDVFSVEGYSLNLSELVPITNLVLGLSALIVGEVFAIGLRMREEQELTI